MADDGPPPMLGADTLETRAAQSTQIWNARQRARDRVTDAFDTIDDPRDVALDRREGGFGPSRDFLGWAEPQEAAHDLDPQFPRQDLGASDVERTEGGFQAREPVRRRGAAYEFEETTGLDDVDPFGDLVATEEGYGLAEPRQRDLAARDLDPQFPLVDLQHEDVRRADDGYGLTPDAERDVAAARFEQDTPLTEVDPDDDIRRGDDGRFELREPAIEEIFGMNPGFFD